MAEKKYANEPARRPQGRPRADSRIARPNRVVTFVTDRDLQFLTQHKPARNSDLQFTDNALCE
jgi:hypothetical protein